MSVNLFESNTFDFYVNFDVFRHVNRMLITGGELGYPWTTTISFSVEVVVVVVVVVVGAGVG